MKLFLASEGSDPRTTQKLDEYVGGLKGKKVTYIPTAKNGNGEGRWEESGTWQFLKTSGTEANCLQLEDYIHGVDKKPFKQTEIIWVTGGAAGYLMYWAIRTGFDSLLPELLASRQYVGSSAGSMVCSKNLDVCEWYIGEQERGASNIPGLGLVDFDFYPHYQDVLYEQIEEKYDGNKIYLVKNGDVVLVEDGVVKVLGEEKVIENV